MRLRGELARVLAAAALSLQRAVRGGRAPQPFTAEYAIEWMGMRRNSTVQLSSRAGGGITPIHRALLRAGSFASPSRMPSRR